MNWIKEFKYTKMVLRVFLILCVFLTISCNSDVLEIISKNSYTESVVFDDPSLATAHVNHAYRLIPWGFIRPLQYARMTDEISGRGGGSSYWRILEGHATPTFTTLLNIWTPDGSYNFSKWRPIKQANEFLAKTADSELDAVLLDRLRGEVKAIRAYAYFRLASFYGGVPLVTEPFDLNDEWNVSRNSYDELMTFVLRELDE